MLPQTDARAPEAGFPWAQSSEQGLNGVSAHIPSASPSLQHPLPALLPPHLPSQPLGEMVKGRRCCCNANPQHLPCNRAHGFEVSRKTLRGRRQCLLSQGWQLPAPLWSAQGRGALGVLQAQGWAGPSWERGRGGEQVAEPVIKSSGSAWPAKVDFPLASGMGGFNRAIAGVWDALGV